MELCWLMAWHKFLFMAFYQTWIPFSFTLMLFSAGMAGTAISRTKAGLNLHHILIQGISFAGTLTAAFGYAALSPQSYLPPLKWEQIMAGKIELPGWLALFFLFTIVIVTWKRGVTCINSPLNRTNMYNRFDLGIFSFLFLLVVQMLVFFKLGYQIPVPSRLLVFYFLVYFFFSLMAICLVNTKEARFSRDFSRYSSLAVTAGASLLVCLAGIAAILAFEPWLAEFAHTAAETGRLVGTPVGHLLLRILQFLWGTRQGQQTPVSGHQPGNPSSLSTGETGFESPAATILFTWGGLAVLLLAVIIVLGACMKLLIDYLFKKTGTDRKTSGRWHFSLDCLWRFILKTGRLVSAVKKRLGPDPDLKTAAGLMTGWGRRSSIPLNTGETPLEYTRRLSARFPRAQDEIDSLLPLVHQTVYAGQDLTPGQRDHILRIKKKLFHPSLWISRLLVRLRPAR